MIKINRDNFSVPSKWQIVYESLGVVDVFSLLGNYNKFAGLPKGNGQKIIVCPGFATDDIITIPLRKFLKSLNYNPIGWGLGRNHGNVPELLELLNKKVESEFAKDKQKIILLGWSLGGYIARESARDNQEKIEKVVTLGSPVVGGPKYTAIAEIYANQQKIDINDLEKEIDERYQIPIDLPMMSIYSKKDNIVGWEACIDYYSPKVINKEIISTHIGLIANWESYSLIAEFLAK
jgi:pimeloyl-ACP methyl ester carboxylesterase